MSVNLTTHYARQYATNVQLLLQIKGSKLRQAVMTGSHVGTQAQPVDQIGAVAATRVTTRFATMPRTDAPTDARWVFPADYDLNQMIDHFDKLRLVTDPTSNYVENAVYALGRSIDDELITAFFTTTAKTGVDGSTNTTFLSTNVVGVNTGGTASNINVPKLRAGKKLLMANQVDLDNDPIYCAITAVEHDSLLNEIQVISSDFNGGDKPVLQEGRVQRFLGINFIHCERLALTTATDDQSGTSTPIPMWAKSGMYLGLWEELNSNVSQRNDIQGVPWQVYCKGTFGATRLEEKKVVKIWCR